MPFMSNIFFIYNEEDDSDNGMIEVLVCDVGTLKKPLLTR